MVWLGEHLINPKNTLESVATSDGCNWGGMFNGENCITLQSQMRTMVLEDLPIHEIPQKSPISSARYVDKYLPAPWFASGSIPQFSFETSNLDAAWLSDYSPMDGTISMDVAPGLGWTFVSFRQPKGSAHRAKEGNPGYQRYSMLLMPWRHHDPWLFQTQLTIFPCTAKSYSYS